MGRTCLTFVLVLTASALAAQQELRDSLKRVLQKSPEDTVRVMTLISLGQLYEGNANDSAIYFYEEALHLSQKLNYPRGIINYYTNVTYVYNLLGRNDTSLVLNLRALEIAREFGDPDRLAACLNNLGSSYHYIFSYDSAAKYYLEAAEVLQTLGDTIRLTVMYSNLAALFKDTGDFNKGLQYGAKSLELARATNSNAYLLPAINNYSISLTKVHQYDQSIALLKEGIAICRETDNRNAWSTLLVNLGDAYIKSGRFPEARTAYEEGLALDEADQNMLGVCIHLRGMSIYFLHVKDWKQAVAYITRSQELALTLQFQDQLEDNYLQISDLALAMGDMDSYRMNRFRNDSVSNLMYEASLRSSLQKLELFYQTRAREQQIEKLQQERELKALQYRNRLYFFGSTILVLISVSVVLFIRARQKRLLLESEAALQEKRIQQLETEKQLLASEAVLRGQEEERKRLAKDLHDGLGGMLSGIKFSFNHMKDNLIMTPRNQEEFARGMDMLDSSIRELRRVAHNMMPESLLRYGLNTALRDFCRDITASGQLEITYQSFDLENLALDQTTCITVYRITQELLNNVMKHAVAQHAMVQLIVRDGKMVIMVEDDGKGFDPLAMKSGGIGWENIKSRVEYLKGQWDIQSDKDKGTSVTIEFGL